MYNFPQQNQQKQNPPMNQAFPPNVNQTVNQNGFQIKNQPPVLGNPQFQTPNQIPNIQQGQGNPPQQMNYNNQQPKPLGLFQPQPSQFGILGNNQQMPNNNINQQMPNNNFNQQMPNNNFNQQMPNNNFNQQTAFNINNQQIPQNQQAHNINNNQQFPFNNINQQNQINNQLNFNIIQPKPQGNQPLNQIPKVDANQMSNQATNPQLGAQTNNKYGFKAGENPLQFNQFNNKQMAGQQPIIQPTIQQQKYTRVDVKCEEDKKQLVKNLNQYFKDGNFDYAIECIKQIIENDIRVKLPEQVNVK
ncbi:unnamed protein product [Paramecium octaurelia]|uniref:Uncharacterized protein n=1 Tax=Paramecium octaurelia TaxID=43137 RepID=A0A8S1S8G1_PAROT|nr:unnamed protein product [Paramecium octaurelia]